jgi:hypothetical protein
LPDALQHTIFSFAGPAGSSGPNSTGPAKQRACRAQHLVLNFMSISLKSKVKFCCRQGCFPSLKTAGSAGKNHETWSQRES